jgi:hypothetical protein
MIIYDCFDQPFSFEFQSCSGVPNLLLAKEPEYRWKHLTPGLVVEEGLNVNHSENAYVLMVPSSLLVGCEQRETFLPSPESDDERSMAVRHASQTDRTGARSCCSRHVGIRFPEPIM